MRIRKWICWLLVFCLTMLAAGSALADLKRGSSGEEVVALQQKLIDIGALDDVADGKFGPKTEKAVKAMQAYWGMKKTGRVGDAFLDKLDMMWYPLCNSDLDSGLDPEEDVEAYVSCVPTEKKGVYEFCPRHGVVAELQGMLKNGGRNAPEGVRAVIYRRIMEAAYAETEFLFDIWESRLDSSEEHIAQEYKEQFEEIYAEKSADLLDYYQKTPLKAYQQLAEWLMEQMVQECYDLYGQEPNVE